MSVAIIINPISGRSRSSACLARAATARSVVAAKGVTAEIFVTERPGHARELARTSAAAGARIVIAWGGDGTINEVASALAFSDVPLGIVPAGSGNGLARELGIDRRPERALAAALSTRSRRIDVGEIEKQLFVSIAGIGVDAYVASRFNDPGNRRRGFLGYAGMTIGALANYAPMEYRISASGGVINVRALLVTLANSAQFGNGARIAPGARLDDGLLDLVFIEARSRWRTVFHLPRLFTGTVAEIPGCRMQPVSEVTVEAERPLTFHVDGEPFEGGTRVNARVHPGALRIVAPDG